MPFLEITNTARAQRGVHTVDGLVMLEAGETRELELSDGEADGLASYFAAFGALPALALDAPTGLAALTVAQLRAHAAEKGVTLPETRLTKAELIAAIEAGPREPGAVELDALPDETLREMVKALIGVAPGADLDRDALITLVRG